MQSVPVILAGGIGERFWPLSRSRTPKQLLSITGKRSMLEQTLDRVVSFAGRNVEPVVVTGKSMAPAIRRACRRVRPVKVIAEPVGKNTAPAVAIAAAWIMKQYGDGVMVVLSADHQIGPKKAFGEAVKCAVRHARETDSLMVFGIPPDRVETGYGYIELGYLEGGTDSVGIYEVLRFVEKPDYMTAVGYLDAGRYHWNSGMFAWKASVILEEFGRHMPRLYGELERARRAGLTVKAIDRFYLNCGKESIDYGIMERSKRVAAVVGKFSWDDVGSWEAMTRLGHPNAIGTVQRGDRIYEKACRDAVIVNGSSRSTVAVIDVDNVAVVVTDDAVLAISRDRLPEIKRYLSEMKKRGDLPASLF